MKCSDCKFYVNGECHRKSPSVQIKSYLFDRARIKGSELDRALHDTNCLVGALVPEIENALYPIMYQGWPKVREDDFCGEFLKK